MGAGNAGKYSAKHPAGSETDPVIVAAIEEVVEEGQVSCSTAHDLAVELGVSPTAIGKALDLLDYRIIKCQMGIFGYGPAKKLLKPAHSVADEMRDRLLSAASSGRISCASCWRIAQASGIQKVEVAAACEHLGLKIKPCQLGAF